MKRGFVVLVITTQLAGCYASHALNTPGEIDASRSDARVLDAPVDRDAARSDAGTDAFTALDAACIPNTDDRILLACILSPEGVLPPMRESILDLERSIQVFGRLLPLLRELRSRTDAAHTPNTTVAS